jgi:hypothetical protein
MTQAFYVYFPAADNPDYQHDSLESAKCEAKRLAKERPGQHFQVLALAGSYCDYGPLWDSADGENIPL